MKSCLPCAWTASRKALCEVCQQGPVARELLAVGLGVVRGHLRYWQVPAQVGQLPGVGLEYGTPLWQVVALQQVAVKLCWCVGVGVCATECEGQQQEAEGIMKSESGPKILVHSQMGHAFNQHPGSLAPIPPLSPSLVNQHKLDSFGHAMPNSEQ